MLLLPNQLTVIPWHYFTVRIISKWNEMYPDLRLAPNVHEYKASATEFVAVGVSYDEFNRMVACVTAARQASRKSVRRGRRKSSGSRPRGRSLKRTTLSFKQPRTSCNSPAIKT